MLIVLSLNWPIDCDFLWVSYQIKCEYVPQLSPMIKNDERFTDVEKSILKIPQCSFLFFLYQKAT